jgi:hypothetical protein
MIYYSSRQHEAFGEQPLCGGEGEAMEEKFKLEGNMGGREDGIVTMENRNGIHCFLRRHYSYSYYLFIYFLLPCSPY